MEISINLLSNVQRVIMTQMLQPHRVNEFYYSLSILKKKKIVRKGLF